MIKRLILRYSQVKKQLLLLLSVFFGFLLCGWIEPAHAVSVDFDLYKGQTLNVIYNQPLRDTVFVNGADRVVNQFSLSTFFSNFSNDSRFLYSLSNDFNTLLWKYETAGGMGHGLDFYDLSIVASLNPWQGSIDLAQFRDGVGSDHINFSITMLEGSATIQEFSLSNIHRYSQTSASGLLDMNSLHYEFNIVPVPSSAILFLFGLAACAIKCRGKK